MKKLFTFALCAISLAAIAADAPTIRVNDLGNVYRVNEDGTETNLGAPYDAITNNPALGSAIQQAAQVRLAQFKADSAATVKAATDSAAAQVATKEVEKQAAITAAQAASAAAIEANAAALSTAQATAATKTTEAATAITALEARTAELAAANATLAAKLAYIDALKAQLVALGAEPVAP